MTKAQTQLLTEVEALVASLPATIPAHRQAFRHGYSCSGLPFAEQLPLWDHVWKHGGSFWSRIHAFFFLEKYAGKPALLPAIWATSVSWQNDVNDWGLCDALAKLNTKALEVLPGEVYPQLQNWNTSPDLWKRRQSVVSLLYFSRTKTVYLPFKKIAALVAPLLGDAEYYVQKGVGWTLREMHTVYPDDFTNWLSKNLADVSAIAFTIAIEKMPPAQKEELKQKRKKLRT